MANKPRYFIKSISRAFEILSTFSSEMPSMTSRDLAKKTSIPESTIFRFVHTFVKLGYMKQDADTKKYSLTTQMLRLGFSAFHSLDIRKASLPHMSTLNNMRGEKVSLCVLHNDGVVLVDTIPSHYTLAAQTTIGESFPIHCSASGKTILAFLPETDRNEILNRIELHQHTKNTITDLKSLKIELLKIRSQGFGINNEEAADGLLAIAAPIFNRQAKIIATLDTSAPTSRYSIEKMIEVYTKDLLAHARAISDYQIP